MKKEIKLMSPAGRKPEGKVKLNITVTPDLVTEGRKIDPNISRLIESSTWKEIERNKRQQNKSGIFKRAHGPKG